jgi:hypothetical protein
MKKQVKILLAELENMGAIKIEKNLRSYDHAIYTYIGFLFFRIDTDGPVLSFFGNYLNNADEAKKELGHWKYNLHTDKKNGFDEFKKQVLEHVMFVVPKKINYTYGILKVNNRYYGQESTAFDNNFNPEAKFALIEKICLPNESEIISRITYSSDEKAMVEKLKKLPSWYNYLGMETKNMQGYISKIN